MIIYESIMVGAAVKMFRPRTRGLTSFRPGWSFYPCGISSAGQSAPGGWQIQFREYYSLA